MPKKYFFLKLHPPRPSFTTDMTPDEKNIMRRHIAYWQPHVLNGTVIVMGPVLDRGGGYGISVVRVDDENELISLISKDPANGLNNYEIHPMRAVSLMIEE